MAKRFFYILALLFFGQNGYAEPQWNEWSSWTQCSATCGYGSQIRSRQCMLNGAPNNSCVGRSIDVPQTCIGQLCSAQWNEWSSWTQCSATCGYGSKIRSRECVLNGATNNSCVGQSIDVPQTCIGQLCSVGGPVWSEWSSWTACTHTCNGGTKVRLRDCSAVSGNCEGKSLDYAVCGTDSCSLMTTAPLDSWTKWSSWSICTATCGGGVRYRSRNCTTYNLMQVNDCSGQSIEIEWCNTMFCEGTWSLWAEWTLCSKTCGLGIKTRTRNCTGLHGENGDFSCTGDRPTETENCLMIKCPGTWSHWAEWTPCSETCGLGIRTRERNCTGLHGENGDFSCTGDSRTWKENCTVKNCPGVWDTWSKWSECTQTCGTGYHIRVRNCTSYDHITLENNCLGKSVDYTTCAEISCPVTTTTPPVTTTTPPVMTTSSLDSWTKWSSWSICTATCGGGLRYKSRNCTTYNLMQVNDCSGQSIETEMCNTIFCEVMTTKSPDHPVWSEWSSWTYCTKTCNGGAKVRSRDCLLLNSTVSGNCEGNNLDYAACATDPCALLPVWSEWSSWTACTHTCNGGAQVRARNCLLPNSTLSLQCEGPSHDYAVCGTDPCSLITTKLPDHPAWSEWSSWTACSYMCDGGAKVRSRDCRFLNSMVLGTCEGPSLDYAVCGTDPCPSQHTSDGHSGLWRTSTSPTVQIIGRVVDN